MHEIDKAENPYEGKSMIFLANDIIGKHATHNNRMDSGASHAERYTVFARRGIVILPRISSKAEYFSLRMDENMWIPALSEIAALCSLRGRPEKLKFGSNIVYAVGESVVKLYPPWLKADFDNERIVLAAMLKLPIPRLSAVGKIDNWSYAIMTRLQGIPAIDVWDSLDMQQKKDLTYQLGKFMRILHGCEIPKGLQDNWDLFRRDRLKYAVKHHNVQKPWRTWIKKQLDNFNEPKHVKVLLNGDLLQDHVILTEANGNYHISGIVDFGNARIGHPHYEFAIPLLDYVYGEPELSQDLLRGYGILPTKEHRDSLTTYCLLHEFATLDDHIEKVPTKSPNCFRQKLWGEEEKQTA